MRRLALVLLCCLAGGCVSLPFDAGHLKEARPYPEGDWVGPVTVSVAEKKILAATRLRRNPTGILFYDPSAEWQKLKTAMQPGDEIWEFGISPFVVDGGDRYAGFSLIRAGRIVACVVTTHVAEHAP